MLRVPTRHEDAASLVSWLATRDAPCPVCSYNLRGLQSDSCPECGAALHLHVGSENLRLGPWLLGVISLTLAVGFDAVVSVILLTGLLFFFRPRSPADFRQMVITISIFLALSIICSAGILILLRRRRQWCLLSRRAQWRIAAAAFLVVFIIHAVIGGYLTRVL